MGKKKGKGGKGGGKKGKKEKPVTDGLLPIDMSRKQLLGHAVRLKAELEKEKEERNYFMLEREKLYHLWNLIMELIAIEKMKVAALKSHLADRENDKRAEDDLYESKLRFLKAEQTRKLGQLRLLHLQQMAQVQDDAWMIHMLMKEALMNKKKEIRRAQMAFYQIIRGLHWQHAKQVSDLRNEFAREIRRLESAFDRSLFEKNEKLEEEQDKELAKLAGWKNQQISFLIDDHAWQVDQMKAFFQELLKVSLEIVNQMKQEVKQQTTAELMQRRDYGHFKHRYDTYVAPALRWSALMDEWTIIHQEDDLDELVQTLKTKEEELKKRKFNLRMLEAANEALNQRILIAEKERNCVKRQFNRAIVDSQRTMSMKRFCQQLKRKAAHEEANLYETLAKTIEDQGICDYFRLMQENKDLEIFDHLKDINDQAIEHDNTNKLYADTFLKNEINLTELGFPVKVTGVKPVPQQDLEIAINREMDKRKKRNENERGALGKLADARSAKLAREIAEKASLRLLRKQQRKEAMMKAKESPDVAAQTILDEPDEDSGESDEDEDEQECDESEDECEEDWYQSYGDFEEYTTEDEWEEGTVTEMEEPELVGGRAEPGPQPQPETGASATNNTGAASATATDA